MAALLEQGPPCRLVVTTLGAQGSLLMTRPQEPTLSTATEPEALPLETSTHAFTSPATQSTYARGRAWSDVVLCMTRSPED